MTLHYRAADSVRPSVLRKVDRVAVGIPDARFRLAVGRSFLDVGRGAPLLAHRNQGLNALHLETEMIDPLLELIAFDFTNRSTSCVRMARWRMRAMEHLRR